jgi:arylsulfatase
LQALPRDRDAYKGAYDAGWDVVRAKRLERQRQLGVVPSTTQLPPLSPGADAWDTLDATQKRIYARYMEVYAGQISNLDANVGRLMAMLEQRGWRDDTLILLFSDNGGSAEGTPTGTPNVFAPAFGRPVPVEEAAKLYDVMGEDTTFPHYPIGWACASNTPYRLYKQYAHLGGVADPLIVAWPRRIVARGEIRHRFVHVIDLYPTILEAAGVTRPEVYRGRRVKPVEGASIVPTFASAEAPTRDAQYFELGGQRAYLDGDWRLATRHERGSAFEGDRWELYDLTKDPNELVDLAASNPDKVRELVAKWEADAAKYGVFPLDDRNVVIKLVQDRQRRGVRAEWDLRPPLERLAQQVAPLVCPLGHTITVELERPAGKGDGVLLAHGSKHAGYVLYVRDGRLTYEQSLVPWSERIESPEPLPAGPVTVKYVQTMTGRPFDGTGALWVGDRKVAEHTFTRVLFNTSYDGFSLGADLGNQVSAAYRGPNPFQGRIVRVRISVDTTPFSTLEQKRFIDAMGIRV